MSRMNVGQLIDLLSGFPSDLPVVVDGYEGGLTEHIHVERTWAVEDYYAGESYIFGEHGDRPLSSQDATLEVVAIHRHQT